MSHRLYPFQVDFLYFFHSLMGFPKRSKKVGRVWSYVRTNKYEIQFFHRMMFFYWIFIADKYLCSVHIRYKNCVNLVANSRERMRREKMKWFLSSRIHFLFNDYMVEKEFFWQVHMCSLHHNILFLSLPMLQKFCNFDIFLH